MWYRDWFRDENYSVVYNHRDEEEAAEVIDLSQRTIGKDTSRVVLDLACGAGRHAIEFAKRGYKNVTGLDLSPTLLQEAQTAAADENLVVKFIESDMRNLPC